MQVSLSQSEVHQALIDFIAKKGIDINGKISIDITAGRKENGVTAAIDINYGVTLGRVSKELTTGCDTVQVEEPPVVSEVAAPWEEEAQEETPAIVEENQADKPLFGN